jgi:hypothetical protein
MKIKVLLALMASAISLTAFAQKAESEMAVYAEKKGNDYYLVRLPKGKDIPNVYVYSNGETKPYKKYKEMKEVVLDFPKMMETNNSTKEELISVLKKDNHFYEITSQRKDPKNFEKTTFTVYEVMDGQKRIVDDYDSIYGFMASPYKEAIFIK